MRLPFGCSSPVAVDAEVAAAGVDGEAEGKPVPGVKGTCAKACTQRNIRMRTDIFPEFIQL